MKKINGEDLIGLFGHRREFAQKKCWMMRNIFAQITLSMHAQLLYIIVLIKISLVMHWEKKKLVGLFECHTFIVPSREDNLDMVRF